MRRVLLWVCLSSSFVWAGGGPETTALVVNGRSPWSRRVADHYAQLRDIPADNVIVLHEVPHTGVISWAEFTEVIWKRIAGTIEERGLQIALVAYSADFPYAVDFGKRVPDATKNRQIGRQASLTGATYFARSMLDEGDFFAPNANSYFGMDLRGATNRRMNAAERGLWDSARAAAADRKFKAAIAAYEKLLTTFGHANVIHYNYACVLARAGRADDALDALAVAVERGFRQAAHARRDEDLRSLRSKPRFQALVKAMGETGNRNRLPLHPARAFDPERDPFLLCVQLAYTGPLGNSDLEIRRYLEAAAAADFTKPDGTVYLCRNGNVRSTTREPFFQQTIERLRALGRKVELLDKTVVPKGKSDVFGAVIGSASYPWAPSKSTILGGAFVESLTSFGAHFQTPSQTKLTELLRHGAAGSTGTVMEPYALWHKFPLPFVHAFYAEGLSLAEAAYYSVSGPYQLAVVGDGLARPCASPADVTVTAPPSPWRGTVKVAAKATAECTFEWFLGGVRVAKGASVEFDTTKWDDGHLDLRAVAVAKDRIATRWHRKLDVVVANGPAFAWDGWKARGTFAKWELYRDGDLVHAGDAAATEAEAAAPTEPGRYVVVAIRKDGSRVRGPLRVVAASEAVQSPVELKFKPKDAPVYAPGLVGTAVGSGGVETPCAVLECNESLRQRRRASQHPAWRKARRVKLAGQVEIPADGWYQFAVRFRGSISFRVGKSGMDVNQSHLGEQFVAGRFAKGWHDIAVDFEPRGAPVLQILLGGDAVPAHAKFRHKLGRRVAEFARTGDPKAVDPASGLELIWKKTQHKVHRVRLDAPTANTTWTVEYATTSRGKWKPVKNLATITTPNIRVGGKNPPKGSAAVELEFDVVKSMRRLRVRPAAKLAVGSIEVARR